MTLMTAQELLDLPESTGPCELVRGELVREAPPGGEHGRIAMSLSRRLAAFIDEHGLGASFAAETGFLLSRNPDTVRAPDFAYVSRERAPAHGFTRGYVEISPDLIVEVLSPSDRYSAVKRKIDDWLAAGTKVAIIVDPEREAVLVYRSPTASENFTSGELLSLPDVLPGFECAVTAIFA